MRQVHFFKIVLLLVLLSCNSKKNKKLNFSLRDTVLREHLQSLDSLTYFDTTDINYKVLKAYQSNDTIFLKKLHTDIENDKKYKRIRETEDSNIHQFQLQNMNVDEAYRFIYTGAFCPFKLNITVAKRGDSVKLSYIDYGYYEGQDTSINRFINYNKTLTIKDWNEIKESLVRADYWGLKRDNGYHGVDGTSITVLGYVKSDPEFNRHERVNYVYRWELTTLREVAHLILKLSDNKENCFWLGSRLF